jgi:hypothetical protein
MPFQHTHYYYYYCCLTEGLPQPSHSPDKPKSNQTKNIAAAGAGAGRNCNEAGQQCLKQ